MRSDDDLIVPATTSPHRSPSGTDDELMVFEDRERLLEHLSRRVDPTQQQDHVPGLRELRHDLGKELELLQLLIDAVPENEDEGQGWLAVRRQATVIREVLDDAVDPCADDEVDVTELARRISSTMSAAHRRDILLCTTGTGVVNGNRGLLRRVLVNLLDNARLASPRGRVRVQVHALRRGVLVEVEDDGSGGATEPRRMPGSGLGLPIVRDIAAWHGGATCCGESSLGGRRVVVALPQAVAT